MGQLILLRHGETEWSRSGRHTGRTDIPLTARGEAAAAALVPAVARRDIVAVFTSPAGRAGRTPRPGGPPGPARTCPGRSRSTRTCGSGTTAATRAGPPPTSRLTGPAGTCGGTASSPATPSTRGEPAGQAGGGAAPWL